MELKRVVVTGLGAITPVGNSVAQAWENLCNGVSGAGPITHFDASAFKTQFACEVKDFKPEEFGIDRKEGRKMDLYTQYAIAAATQAITDSGMDLETEDKNRIGVVFGVGIGGMHTFEEEAGNWAVNGATMGPKFIYGIKKSCSNRSWCNYSSRQQCCSSMGKPLQRSKWSRTYYSF